MMRSRTRPDGRGGVDRDTHRHQIAATKRNVAKCLTPHTALSHRQWRVLDLDAGLGGSWSVEARRAGLLERARVADVVSTAISPTPPRGRDEPATQITLTQGITGTGLSV